MQVGRRAYLLFFIFLAALVSPIVHAQIGEVAGFVYINASVGGSASGTWTIVNPSNQSVSYEIMLPTLSGGAANQTTPTVTITPSKGVIPAHSQLKLNVTAYVPSNDKVGLTWTGIAEALVAPNTSVSGATLQAGTAKNIFINSIAPKTNWLLIAVVAVVILAIVIAVLLLLRRRRAQAAGSALAAAKGTKKVKAAKAKRKKGPSKAKKKRSRPKTAKRRRR